MREILEEELPDASITTSAEILPEMFEYGRFNTAVANAVLAPLVTGYVNRLSDKLHEGGYAGDLLLLHSGGGSMTPRTVDQFPVRLAASGIAAGAISAQHVASQCGYANAVSLDMGGTSTDISLVADGELRITQEWSVEYGHPIIFPSIEVKTIGAGGGSLAHIDIAGSLRNGPQSAGAAPGPACYDTGGDQPTNTDANLVLGRLGTSLADGAKSLDKDLAAAAIQRVIAEPLGLTLEKAAESIIQVANANMADAVRIISIRRGHDPRDFALLAFGGAGALHGVDVARELNIPTVVVPPNPGVTSAMGCLLVDIQHDFSRQYTGLASEADIEELEANYRRVESEAAARLRHEGVSDDRVVLQRLVSMRYVGQWRSLVIPMGHGKDALNKAIEAFHEQHEREFAFRNDETPVELYQLQLHAVGKTTKPNFQPAAITDGGPGEPVERRSVYFDGQWHETPIYNRSDIPAGAKFTGPAIINQLDSTTVVPPETDAEVDEWLNIRIHIRRSN